jgi:ribosomal protein S27AE
MEKESVFCPRCGEFLGEIGNLENCPVCGYDFEENYEINEEF